MQKHPKKYKNPSNPFFIIFLFVNKSFKRICWWCPPSHEMIDVLQCFTNVRMVWAKTTDHSPVDETVCESEGSKESVKNPAEQTNHAWRTTCGPLKSTKKFLGQTKPNHNSSRNLTQNMDPGSEFGLRNVHSCGCILWCGSVMMLGMFSQHTTDCRICIMLQTKFIPSVLLFIYTWMDPSGMIIHHAIKLVLSPNGSRRVFLL